MPQSNINDKPVQPLRAVQQTIFTVSYSELQRFIREMFENDFFEIERYCSPDNVHSLFVDGRLTEGATRHVQEFIQGKADVRFGATVQDLLNYLASQGKLDRGTYLLDPQLV
jgi:hypothetical protein